MNFWVKVYKQKESKISDKEYYEPHININGMELKQLEEENIKNLFFFKFQKTKLFESEWSIVNNSIKHLNKINNFRKKVYINWKDYNIFLERIVKKCTSGPVYGAYIVHIARPLDFPIIDQHVIRAYIYLRTNKVKINITKRIINDNYKSYVEFFREEGSKLELKAEGYHHPFDKALWAFGKFLKDYCH